MQFPIIILAILAAIAAYLILKPKKAAKITAFEWSPTYSPGDWQCVDSAAIGVGAWFWRMSWTNNLEAEVYYTGSFAWDGEIASAETFAFAKGDGALTLTGSGLPGSYKIEASLADRETGKVVDSVTASFTVI